MGFSNRFIEWRTTNANPVFHDNIITTPISRALLIRFPFGGFVWNQPVAVQVEDEDGPRSIRIVDVTLLVQLILYVAGIVFTLLYWVICRRYKS